jgi:nitronate monooxygenase
MTPPSTLMDVLRRPVVVAPMAGGPSTADLVVAAARAGALGFLAAGYKTPGAMAGEIAAVRAATSQPFGVNLFVPGTPYPDAAALARYLGSVGPAADLGEATWDDDGSRMSLFAGQGYRSAADQPAGEIIERLCAEPS